jgi:hypothetical protein
MKLDFIVKSTAERLAMAQQLKISTTRSRALVSGTTYKGLGRIRPQCHSPIVMQGGYSSENMGRASISRRKQGIILVGSAVLSLGIFADPSHALGKSAKELAREAKERRAKLKETAEKMRSAGKASDAFESSNYSVPEEATTPNVVNRNRNVD